MTLPKSLTTSRMPSAAMRNILLREPAIEPRPGGPLHGQREGVTAGEDAKGQAPRGPSAEAARAPHGGPHAGQRKEGVLAPGEDEKGPGRDQGQHRRQV